MMCNSRIVTILRELIAAKSASSIVTSEYLANINRVTSRTARNDMKELDTLLSKHGAGVKSIRGTGYELEVWDDQAFHRLLQELFQDDSLQQGGVPDTQEERVQYLLQRLLLTSEYVKLEDLADDLYISKSTVQNDLRDVKRILQQYGIVLEKRPNYGLKLKGEEIKLRFCMSEYIFNQKARELDKVNEQLSIIAKEEIIIIRNIILRQIKEYGITLSDVALNNLIIHIAIACKRIRSGNHVFIYENELSHIIKQNEYKAAEEIVEAIEESLQIAFPQTEVAYIAIHLLGTKLVTHTDMDEENLQVLMDKEIYPLTLKVLEGIESKLELGIRHDKELILGISLHLKPAINRYRYGMNLRNPMLEAIKTNYPIAFEAAILAGMILEEELEIKIDENEIGYLALHIGAAIERKKMQHQPKRCMIVCASGVGSAKLVYYRLQSKFGSSLEIVGTTEYYKLHQVPLHTLDFIISTIPIPDSLPIPVIEVNTILDGNDIEKIKHTMLDQSDETIEYTREELVFLQQRFETQEEVLRFLGDNLQKQGLVGEGFIDSVFQREAVSPTSFGNLVAIPHPIMPETDSTFWSICTLQKPIVWKDKQVQFVCLLSVEKNSTADLQKMYNLLGKVVEDQNLVQQLLKCKTYNEFTRVFLKQGY